MSYYVVKVKQKKSIKFKLTANKLNYIDILGIKILFLFNNTPKHAIENSITIVFIVYSMLFNIIHMHLCRFFQMFADSMRLELMAHGLKILCSTWLSYIPYHLLKINIYIIS